MRHWPSSLLELLLELESVLDRAMRAVFFFDDSRSLVPDCRGFLLLCRASSDDELELELELDDDVLCLVGLAVRLTSSESDESEECCNFFFVAGDFFFFVSFLDVASESDVMLSFLVLR